MSHITLPEIARAFDALESIVRDEKEYITIAEMLDIADIAQKGVLGKSKLCPTRCPY